VPSTSKKQHNFMEAVAHNPSFAKKVGVPQKVGQDFTNADKGRKFSKGGDTMATKMDPRVMAMMMARKRAPMAAPAAPMGGMGGGMGGMKKGGMANFEKSGKDVEPKGMKEGSKKEEAYDKSQMGMKRGGGVKKMAGGGYTRAADGIAQRGKTRGTQIVMKKGGKVC
jgi:hypothetical protein